MDKLRLSRSTSVYIALVVLLAVLAAANMFLPQGTTMGTVPQQEMPASAPVMALAVAGIMLVIYGGLGAVGLLLARRLGFPEIWDPAVTNRQRFLLPALWGVGCGLFFVVADSVFQRWHTLGPLPHPPFPTSIVASASAGIGEEILFRLFFISLWVWLISRVILRGRAQTPVFWGVAVVSALAFAAGHLPSAMFLLGTQSITDIPAAILAEMLLLNGTVSLLAAYGFRRYGFLAAVGVHFWTDIVWHVVWGLIA